MEEYRRWLLRNDMWEDAHRSYFGLVVTVEVDEMEVGHASLWAIDTIDTYPARGYLMECAEQLIDEALDEARKSLPKKVKKLRKQAKQLRKAAADLA
jgi:hypothetical protein